MNSHSQFHFSSGPALRSEPHRRSTKTLVASALLIALAACGGGGSGGSGTSANGNGQSNAPGTQSTVKASETSKHLIGGAVSGLAGSGLVLQNNSGDDIAVSADGSFAFATALAEGAGYGVTVKTQPADPTQVCTVNAGSGTVGTAAVTNVAVTCSTSSFKVGGSVSSLQGSGLVIQNNGGDDIAISADGRFRFDTAVASGANYAVTVKTQPSGPTQTCSVGKGNGKTVDATIDDVAIVCSTSSFPVGGSISNLQGSGLVLRNNSETLPVPAGGSGSFTFADPVASGADYTVTVEHQPSNPSQTCTVANQTGTIDSGAVNTVSVSCSVNKFNVSLNVSGLDGVGLVLQNNSGDDINVTANGGYTFATPVASGAHYEVSVKTQPSLVTQNCTVAQGIGTIGGADVTDVAVACQSQIPRFAFMTAQGLSTSGRIVPFSVDGSGAFGALDAGFTATSDVLPTSIAVDALGKHAYATTATGISQYNIDSSGAVTPMTNPEVSAGTAPLSLALDPKGRFAYVLNVTQNKITMLPIGVGGALGTANPVSVGGVGVPIGFTVESSGRFVYVANSGSRVSGFEVDESNPTATLKSAGTPLDFGLGKIVANLVTDASGKFLYVLVGEPLRNRFTINGYAIQSNGSLTSMGAALATLPLSQLPSGFVAHPSGKFVYLTLGNGALRTFSINTTSGALTPVGSDTSSLGGPILRATVDAAGRFLYAATGNKAVAFPIDHDSGALGGRTDLAIPTTAITSLALGV